MNSPHEELLHWSPHASPDGYHIRGGNTKRQALVA